MIKYLFLDVADTILHKPALYKTIQNELKRSGFEISIKKISSNHQLIYLSSSIPTKTSEEFYTNFNTQLLKALGIKPTARIIHNIYHSCKELEWKPFFDTDILKFLDIPIGIISNWDETLELKLKKLFNIHFFMIISSYNTKLNKPDEKIFKKVLIELGCRPNEVLYIGNSLKHDIIPAENVGMKTILIDRHNIFNDYEGIKIRNLREVKKYLKF